MPGSLLQNLAARLVASAGCIRDWRAIFLARDLVSTSATLAAAFPIGLPIGDSSLPNADNPPIAIAPGGVNTAASKKLSGLPAGALPIGGDKTLPTGDEVKGAKAYLPFVP